MTIPDDANAYLLDTLEDSVKPSTTAFGANILSLGVLWHRDPDRIGGTAPLQFDRNETTTLSRLTPEFGIADGVAKSSLSDQHISRTPILIKRVDDRRFVFAPPSKEVSVTVNGRALTEPAEFDFCELGDEIIIVLSNAVVLSLFYAPARNHSNALGDDLGLIGVSRCIASIRADIDRVAEFNVPILIRGETGTGKELAARAIHAMSGRARNTMVSINMAAIAPTLASSELFGVKRGAFTGATGDKPGLFEQADGGTLFLDEIGDTPQEVQPMLLRTLEFGEVRRIGDDKTRKVDVRIIAATDRLLQNTGQEPSFNQPLLQRLSGFSMEMPALRKRRIDIGVLLREFWKNSEPATRAGVLGTLRAYDIERLALHDWPGNVRELRNVARQIEMGQPVVNCVSAADLVAPVTPETGRKKGSEKKYRSPTEISDSDLLEALHETGWVIKDAAKALNISRTALYDLMAKSPNVRSVDDFTDDEIRDVVETVSGGISAWAKHLQVGREALRRKIQSMSKL